MKTIQLCKRKFYVKASIVICSTMLILFVLLFAYNGSAQERYPIEYTNFLSEAENIFLLHPNVVKDIFFDLVELKGNPKTAKMRINSDVLGCKVGVKSNRGCRIGKLKLEQKKQNIPRQLIVPVNFTHISASKESSRKMRVHLSWRPEFVEPPAISLEQFLEDIWAAKESQYFKVKKGIERIQLNTTLDRDIYFITDNSMANSLVNVYKQLPIDKNDTITFDFDYTVSSKRYITMDYFIHLKAVSVFINHQVFTTTERKRQKSSPIK